MTNCCDTSAGHTVIIGFGVPGRAVADSLHDRGLPLCIIELNAATVMRCSRVGWLIIEGDAREAEVLQRAKIETATMIVVAIPNDPAVVEIVKAVRKLNKTAKLFARCHFTSKGIEAQSAGADGVVIEEQVVASELVRLVG